MCYFVGPYPPGNTATSTVIDHVWVYELNESGGGGHFPPSAVTIPLNQPVGSIATTTSALAQLGRVTATYTP